MEISFIVVLWVIVSVIQAIAERRQPPPPPAEFEVELPPANEPIKPAEVHEVNLAELYLQRKAETPKPAAPKVQPKPAPVEEKEFEAALTPAAAMNAIILSEILDKPKALRRRR